MKFGVVGCGAVSEANHLPAMIRTPEITIAGVADPAVDRAKRCAKKFSVPFFTADYRDLLGRVDTVVVATPNYLHAPISNFFLSNGVHVLVEKPLAIRSKETEGLSRSISLGKAVLGVGMIRRQYPSSRLVYQILRSGWLGKIKSIVLDEGDPFDWPLRTGYVHDIEKAGGGVLLAQGIHLLDLIEWWFGEVPHRLAYEDDGASGLEGEARLQFDLNSEQDDLPIGGTMRVSFINHFSNTVVISAEKGDMILNIHDRNRVLLRNQQAEVRTVMEDKPMTVVDCFARQYSQFLGMCSGKESSIPTLAEGADVLAFIEECYLNRSIVLQPWERIPILGETAAIR